MKIGDEVFVHGYVDEMRKDVIIIRNNGGYFGTIEGEIVIADTPQTMEGTTTANHFYGREGESK